MLGIEEPGLQGVVNTAVDKAKDNPALLTIIVLVLCGMALAITLAWAYGRYIAPEKKEKRLTDLEMERAKAVQSSKIAEQTASMATLAGSMERTAESVKVIMQLADSQLDRITGHADGHAQTQART